MAKKIAYNIPYALWFIFYFVLFWWIFGASQESFNYLLLIYAVCIGVSFTEFGEGIFRAINGIRPLKTNAEIEALKPIFDEVYEEAKKTDKNIFKNIDVFIIDTMEINAFAAGRSTLVITRGSMELLSKDMIRGIMAHEFGHFSNYDTVSLLVSNIGNITLTVFIKVTSFISRNAGRFMPNEDKTFMTNLLCKALDICQRLILFIGDMILMPISRRSEFKADRFASACGYGDDLLKALKELNSLMLGEPGRFFEQLRSTHPPMVDRIGELSLQMK